VEIMIKIILSLLPAYASLLLGIDELLSKNIDLSKDTKKWLDNFKFTKE